MKKLWLKICSLVLVIVMTVNSLPMTAFAEQHQGSESTSTEVSAVTEQAEDQSVPDTSDVKIVEELVDSRTEFTKEFLLDNGLSLAVVYGSAVHYEKDGQWEEIDNTLLSKADGTITNTAGVWDVSFPQQITENNQISITKDGYMLSFGMAGELWQQENLEVMSIGEEIAADSSISNTQSAVPDETVSEASLSETAPTEPVLSEVTTHEIIAPEATVSETTIPAETIPEETVPDESVPEETFSESILIETIPALDTNTQTASVMVNGTEQTFALNTANTAQGLIQVIDHSESMAAAEYKETILTRTVSQLRYSDVYTNTDVQYDLKGNQVKESIIMESYDSKLRGYRYSLDAGDLVPVLNDDGSIYFYDGEQENVIMSMPAPFLLDNNLDTNYDVQVSLSQTGSEYTLVYLLPQSWLADAGRAWPVILDPVIVADLKDVNTHDATVLSARPNESSRLRATMQIGHSANDDISYSYIKFMALPNLSAADVIINASFSLYKVGSRTTAFPATVHKVPQEWEVSGLCWNNKPGYDTTIVDYATLTTNGRYYWDVTDIARDWYTGANTGLMIKATDEIDNSGESTAFREFYSSDYGGTETDPWLTIIYRNNNGLESYWDYTSSSAGRAGTSHINQYTGNLVWVHNDLGFGGNRMPVSIHHVYNANDNTNNTFGMGAGWRTNFNQRVYLWDSNSDYYIWEDADGTMHYFEKESTGVYKDEDGLELTLTNTGSGTNKFCITDKYGNTSYFDTYGRLTQQVNNQATKSSIDITYTTTSGYLISSVTDGAGRKYNFEYNSSNLLNKITYVGTGTSEITSVSYGYTSSNLTSITYKDGKKSAFTYSTNNLLTSATDVDGYSLKFEYNTTTAGQPSRVSKISEYDGSVAGGVMNFEYAHNQTTCTDHNGNVQILQFNDMGNTISVQDGEGRAQYAKYAKNDSDETGKGNQLVASSKLQNTVSNLLPNSSFEESSLSWYITEATLGYCARTSEQAYLGSSSLKVTRTTERNQSLGVYTGIDIEAGETYTFSAYIKTGASAAILHFKGVDGSYIAGDKVNANSDWTRVEMSYTNPTNAPQRIFLLVLTYDIGVFYMDCVQCEKAPTASRYNLLQNGDFTISGSPAGSWSGTGTGSADIRATVSTSAAPQMDTNVMTLTGTLISAKKIFQTIPVSGSVGDSYVIGGWAQADSVPLNVEGQNREFGIRLIFNNTDGTQTTTVAQFNCDTNSTANWQYSAAAAVADKAYSSITVELAYDYNANTAYFDGIQLFKEQFSESYTYDTNGNVTSVVDLQKQTTKYEYSNNNLTKEILPTGATLTYVYDNYHNVTQATTDTGVVYKFTYDTYGNNTAVEIVSGSTSIKSTAAYSSDGNRMTSATDATGKTTTYDYDTNTNVLKSVKYPEDSDSTKTNYTYDSMYRMATAAATTDTGLTMSAKYTYTDDMLTSIQTGSTTYTFGYGNFALRSNVKIGSRTLASYTYTSQNNYLDTLAYGNSDSVKYTYDQQGRVTQQTYEDGDTVTYRYDNDGALAAVTDSATGITTTYYYDFIDRMMKYVETGSGYSHSVGYEYDTINNLTKMVETINGTEYSTAYTYDDDNRVTSVTRGNAVRNYSYDSYGRASQQITKHGTGNLKTDTFSYTTPSSAATSAQVTGHTIDAASYDRTFAYTYDNNGNILSVSGNGKTVSYVYDSANQLIRENNQISNKTTTWTYDNAGNIKTRKEYAYTTGTVGSATDTVDYTYGDSSWKDLLTIYDGKTISYDNIGNPLSDGTRTYTWKHGRQLATVTAGGSTWTNTYNADGLRTKRTNGSTTYSYVYNGDKLSQMTVGSNLLYFSYDASGTPMAVLYNGTNYYYVTNIQGDVIAILNTSGAAVVEYAYDAWGNIISTTGSMASTLGAHNPLRYRSYIYDSETGLYYLQSRYYNPETGRYLNADALTSTGQGILGNNMFAYCNNNPIIGCDPTGTIPVLDAYIHREVLKEINARNKELSYEQTCVRYRDNNGEFTGKWGFCDLYNVRTGEVWELKKNSTSRSCQTSNALIQLEKYTKGRLLWRPDLPLTKPSTTNIAPGHFTKETPLFEYSIDYWNEGNGILRYDYSVSVKTDTLSQAAGIVGIAMFLLMGAGGYVGFGGLALA